jgi:Na+/H+ antiporter NhaD/arsenite permease-like protein
MSSERLSNSPQVNSPTTIKLLVRVAHAWSQETFPTATAALTHLPYTLVPFTLTMSLLVQALVNTGWIQVFAHGWAHWVDKTGTVGSIAGMGFISVVLCNFCTTLTL